MLSDVRNHARSLIGAVSVLGPSNRPLMAHLMPAMLCSCTGGALWPQVCSLVNTDLATSASNKSKINRPYAPSFYHLPPHDTLCLLIISSIALSIVSGSPDLKDPVNPLGDPMEEEQVSSDFVVVSSVGVSLYGDFSSTY